jgi:peptidoglycan-N-acetylglucosamine deacetylase
MPVPNRIEIPAFPAGKRIALTTSWDDGTVHDRRIVESFNQWGLKGTFNLNSGQFGRQHSPGNRYIQAAEVADLYAGHEVAIHTVTHPCLDRLDPSQIATEVLDDRKALEDLVGYPVRGMAYPFGTYNAQVIQILRSLGIVYSRTVENRDNPWPAPEPLAWAATAHQFSESPLAIGERFLKWYENPHAQGLYFIWGHSYEFNTEDPKRNWSNLQRLFQPLAGKPDVWYCTNIQLFDYEEARKRLVIAANRGSAFNPSALAVTLKADDRLLTIPPGTTVALTT